MTPNQRLAALRLQSGFSHADLAARLGISDPWYRDLEGHPNDVAETLDVVQLCALARLLGVRPSRLFVDAEPDSVTPAALASRIQDRLVSTGETADEFGERVGWEVTDFLRDPTATALTMNVQFLQDVCRDVGMDWIAVLEGCCPGGTLPGELQP